MRAKFKSENRINTNVLFTRLKDISVVNKKNEVSFHAFEYEELEWTFLSLIEFGSFYSIESKKRILQNTFVQLALEKDYSKAFFFETLVNQIKEHNKKQERNYYLLTSLSIKELPVRKTKIDNSQIFVTGNKFPKKFRTHRDLIHISHRKTKENNDYLKIVVLVRARDFREAYEKAFSSFEVFRAMLCLVLNSPMELRIGSYSAEPINKLRLGEFSSLHLEDGTCANDNYYWYEPNFKIAKLLNLNLEKKEILKSNIKWLTKKYNLCTDKHKITMGKALNIYVSAFDESNRYICFLRAWTALETILNTDQNDILIKRCVALYKDGVGSFQKQVLEGLRNYRNEFVHEGENGLDPFVACFKIQEFIYNLIIKFNFRYAGFFNTIEEATLFLDNYSPNLKELKTKKKILDKAIDLKVKNT